MLVPGDVAISGDYDPEILPRIGSGKESNDVALAYGTIVEDLFALRELQCERPPIQRCGVLLKGADRYPIRTSDRELVLIGPQTSFHSCWWARSAGDVAGRRSRAATQVGSPSMSTFLTLLTGGGLAVVGGLGSGVLT